jgi:MFS family permease
MSIALGTESARSKGITSEQRKILIASSLGTVFEWYDFILFGSLAPIIAANFFTAVRPDTAFVFALLAFSAAYAVRPLGAVIFGRIGDMVGRKNTFIATVAVMGTATFLVGMLPTYATWGLAAPILLLCLRFAQGVSLGGESGGAVTYVSEYSPNDQRGYFTSFIQCMAPAGVLLSLIVVIGLRLWLGEAAFADWGWRLPFLFSLVLLVISVWIRTTLDESPVFMKMKAEGKISKAPLSEAFGSWRNIRIAIAVLLVIAATSVISQVGLVYGLLFLSQTLKLPAFTVNVLVGLAIAISLPFYPLVGRLSDRIGRKPLVIFGCLLAAATYFPIVKAITHFANPAYERALVTAPVVLVTNPKECSIQFNPTGTAKFLSSCDIAKELLARAGINYAQEGAGEGAVAKIKFGNTEIQSFEGRDLPADRLKAQMDALRKAVGEAATKAGYPQQANIDEANLPMVFVLLVLLALYGVIPFAPVSAVLVELFPTRIRYTAMSVPSHLGNGWIGGFMTPASFAIVAASGNIYFGMWYPIFWALVGAAVYFIFVPETKGRDLEAIPS